LGRQRVRTLVLGGVRSGKSRHAESLAHAHGGPVTVIVTATANDEEMRARIAAHRARRPDDWTVVEEPIHLAATLRRIAGANGVVLVDCLTLWLTNLLCSASLIDLERERKAFFDTLPSLAGEQVFVGNEVGLGIVPANALARRFADEAGQLHQRLAASCERVTLMAAGLPLILKEPP
jgi:adenosylcobinamide kinase / adenosylcobinamide-phosphate guanylyltransferase